MNSSFLELNGKLMHDDPLRKVMINIDHIAAIFDNDETTGIRFINFPNTLIVEEKYDSIINKIKSAGFNTGDKK